MRYRWNPSAVQAHAEQAQAEVFSAFVRRKLAHVIFAMHADARVYHIQKRLAPCTWSTSGSTFPPKR